MISCVLGGVSRRAGLAIVVLASAMRKSAAFTRKRGGAAEVTSQNDEPSTLFSSRTRIRIGARQVLVAAVLRRAKSQGERSKHSGADPVS